MKLCLHGFLLIAAGLALAGCAESIDETDLPEVQRAGIIGRTLELTGDVDLTQCRVFNRTVLGLNRRGHGFEGEVVGSVPEGTRLVILKVEMFHAYERKTDWGLMVHHGMALTYARIESGPRQGLVVATDGIGINAFNAKLPDSVR